MTITNHGKKIIRDYRIKRFKSAVAETLVSLVIIGMIGLGGAVIVLQLI